MVKKLNLLKGIKLGLVLFLGIFLSCSNEDTLDTSETENLIEESEDLPIKDPETILLATTCNETRFPTLGPGALAGITCSDIPNPRNIGTLDCRTNVGGYTQEVENGLTYGVYSITGSSARYPDTRARVERSFQTVGRGVSRTIKFTARIIIDDLSDIATNFIQVHAEGEIVDGLHNGEQARSAIIAVQAVKTSNNNLFKVNISNTVVPFTNLRSGNRESRFLINMVKGEEYLLEFTTGYDRRQRHFTIAKMSRVGDASKSNTVLINHTFTTTRAALRYGAYEASDSGDRTAKIRFRGTTLCRRTN